MKFDKETILKQRFWFLLALAVPLTLGAFFILMTTVRAQITANRNKLNSDLKSVSASDIKNEKWVKVMEEKAKKMAAIEEKVWQEAYESQKKLYTWPAEIEKVFRFTNGLFATDIKAEKKAAATSPKSDANHFHGVVTEWNQDFVKVKNAAENATKTFQLTAKIKVTLDGKESDFPSLRKGYQVAVTFLKGKYFFDPLTDREQSEFAKNYDSQIQAILEQVNPINDNGVGVIQFPNWTYKEDSLPPASANFFRYVAKWDANIDISEEAWLAQEDLWVQREIYRIIREANNYVSVLTSTEKEGQGGEKMGATYTFKNPYWELSLTLAGKKKLGVKIKNLLPRRQKLDLDFRVQLQKNVSNSDDLETITLGGEPFAPLETRELIEHDVGGLPATGIYGVEQVIDWETAAVKRIDHISLGYLTAEDCCHGHRTYPEGLKPFREKKDGGKDAVRGQQPPGPGPGPGKGFPGIDPKMGKGGKGVRGGESTPNGLRPDRYIEKPTRQTRRIPVGVALIVDQQHVDRVLLAFSKSLLRFVTTQVILNRYPHSLRPSGANSQPAKKGFNPKGFNPKGFNPKGFNPKEFGGFPGPEGFRQQPAAGASSEQESNVELVIYGIVTLYERYPPRPKTP